MQFHFSYIISLAVFFISSFGTSEAIRNFDAAVNAAWANPTRFNEKPLIEYHARKVREYSKRSKDWLLDHKEFYELMLQEYPEANLGHELRYNAIIQALHPCQSSNNLNILIQEIKEKRVPTSGVMQKHKNVRTLTTVGGAFVLGAAAAAIVGLVSMNLTTGKNRLNRSNL